jgi:hypothetical protein
MISAYIVAGPGGVGKSSVIRALTGIGAAAKQPLPWYIEFVQPTGLTRAFVSPTSLQERPNWDWTTPEGFVRKVDAMGCRHVILALRCNATMQRPPLVDYIKTFYNNNWSIYCASIERCAPLLGNISLTFLHECVKGSPAASNSNAALLRKSWGII